MRHLFGRWIHLGAAGLSLTGWGCAAPTTSVTAVSTATVAAPIVASATASASASATGSGKAVELSQFRVRLSPPVLVNRSAERAWFPGLMDLGNGRLLAAMSTSSDSAGLEPMATYLWSDDKGQTWSGTKVGMYPGSFLRLSNGDSLMLPSALRFDPNGLVGYSQVVPRGKKELIKAAQPDLKVTGLPRAPAAIDRDGGHGAFGFNGPVVQRKNGEYLATLYGLYNGDTNFHLVTATSRDGKNWAYLSTVATPSIIPRGSGGEGPTEASLARLKDGRLMCIFRISSSITLGQAWSDNDGKTWTEPRRDFNKDQLLSMPNEEMRSVQPRLAVLPTGAVLLSTGRPGVAVWVNAKGDGVDWERIDVSAYHNALHPDEPHIFEDKGSTNDSTSGYTGIVVLPGNEVLVIYDRMRDGWDNLPKKNLKASNSVWLLRLTFIPKAPAKETGKP